MMLASEKLINHGGMTKPRHLKTLPPVILLSCLTSCQTTRDASQMEEALRALDAQKKREVSWIKQRKLIEATHQEIAVAEAGEVRFVGTKASIPGHSLSVVFKMGTMRSVKDAEVSYLFTTTSYYEVRDLRTGKTPAKTQSTLSAKLAGEMGYKQKVLVSQDGWHLLIYETWCDGSQHHDVYALVSMTPGEDGWSVKYLELPEFSGYEGINDHGPIPVGFAGEYLLFKPLASDKIYKKILSEFSEANHPLPFTVG